MTIWTQLAIACPLIFIAGFIDSIAGGGGLISLPAFYAVGLPPHLAIGTNKFANCWGTLSATIQYLRGGFVKKSIIPVSVVMALIGAFFGARIVLYMSEGAVRAVMLVLIPVIAVITVLKKDFLSPKEPVEAPKHEQLLTAACALVIGLYDGFFGPGTGTFLMLAFMGIIKLDAVTACGNTKVVNLCSNLMAVAVFTLGGKVFYALAIPCAISSIAGNMVGSRLTMKNGAKISRPVMLVVVGLLLITLGKDAIVAAMGR